MRGFTLYELLTVVITAGVVLLMAAPRVVDTWHRVAVRGAFDEFTAAHRKTRMAALRFNRTAQLSIDVSAQSFWVQVDTSLAGTGVMDTVGAVVRLTEDDVDLQATRSLVCFDSRGIATSVGSCQPANMVVVFSRGAYVDTLTSSATGLVIR